MQTVTIRVNQGVAVRRCAAGRRRQRDRDRERAGGVVRSVDADAGLQNGSGANRQPAARRPQFSRPRAARAGRGAGGAGIGGVGARRLRVQRQRRARRRQRLSARRRLQLRSEAEHASPCGRRSTRFANSKWSRSTPDASFGKNAGGAGQRRHALGDESFAAHGLRVRADGAFNARNYFAPKNEDAPDYNRNQFGGSIGGAITKDRLFFFADYEGTRLTEGLTRVTNVPTLAERDGDFSASRCCRRRRIRSPVSRCRSFPTSSRTRSAGRSRRCIRSRIAARRLPTTSRRRSQTDDVDQFDLRVDCPARRQGADCRATASPIGDFFEPFAGSTFSAVPGYGNDVPRRAQNLVVPARVRSAAGSSTKRASAMTRIAAACSQQGQGTSINQQVGLPDLSPNPRDWGLSFISVAGYSSLGHEYNNPQDSTTNLWQFADTLTWSRGAHFLKMGGELRCINQEAFRDVQARGLLNVHQLRVHRQRAGRSAARAAERVTVGADARQSAESAARRATAFFLQDSVSLSPTVTVTAGLRYELNTPPVDANDRVDSLRPRNRTAGRRSGTEGMPRGGYEADMQQLRAAPRRRLVACGPTPSSAAATASPTTSRRWRRTSSSTSTRRTST